MNEFVKTYYRARKNSDWYDGQSYETIYGRENKIISDVDIVKINPYDINTIYKPSEEVKLAAVQKKPRAIANIHNPSEEVQLAAVKKKRDVIQFIDNPTEKTQMLAVRGDIGTIIYIDNPAECVIDFLNYYISRHMNTDKIDYFYQSTKKLLLLIVKYNPSILKYIKNQSDNTMQFIKNLYKSELGRDYE